MSYSDPHSSSDTSSAADIPLLGTPKPKIMHYFHDLEIKGHGSQERFAEMWQDMENRILTPKDLSIILHRTAKYLSANQGVRSLLRPVVMNNLSIWIKKAKEHMGRDTAEPFNAQQLCTTAWAIAKLGLPLGQKFWRPWRATMMDVLQKGELNGQNASNMIWALAKLDLRPDEEFFKAWQVATVKLLQTGELNAQNNSNTLWALATLGIVPGEECMQALRANAHDILWHGALEARDVNNSLWALSVLDNLAFHPDNHNLAYEFMAHNAERQEWEGEQPGVKHDTQAAMAATYFDFNAFPARAWREGQSRISDFERELADMFRPVAAIDMNDVIASLGHRVDISVSLPGAEPVMVELDGYHHFTTTLHGATEKFNGSTLLMAHLIREAVPDRSLLRVPYTVQQELDKLPQTLAPEPEPKRVRRPRLHRIAAMLLGSVWHRPFLAADWKKATKNVAEPVEDPSAPAKLRGVLRELRDLPPDAYMLTTDDEGAFDVKPMLPRVDYRQESARAYNIP